MKYLFALLLTVFLFVRPGAVHAETANCTNITALPATISAQGIYCLKQDLSTSLASGTAIDIQANNVTLDCNGYKIGDLAAGLTTQAVGIQSMQRSNITIRNCNIRGFWIGINLAYNAGGSGAPPSGQVVEMNRIDQSTREGIFVGANASVIRRNIVIGTGTYPSGDNAIAIETFFNTDVIDNTIDGVSDTSDQAKQVYGIITWSSNGNTIVGNRVRGLKSNAGTNGIQTTYSSTRMSIRDNVLVNEAGSGYAISCVSNTVIATGNQANGFDQGIAGCLIPANDTNVTVM